MSSDDYQVHNIYRYTRKTYKQNRRGTQDTVFDNSRENGAVDSVENSREDVAFDVVECPPRNDDYGVISPECHYDPDPEGVFANILHKKCPVITLAQQQLLRLLDETNRIVRIPNTSPIKRYLCFCQDAVFWQNKSNCMLVSLIFVAFFAGLLFGAATCGTRYGKFNNPILDCIDNYFIPDHHLRIEDTFHCIT